jgi:hypothetical protein
MQVVESAPSFVILQRAHLHGVGTECLSWCINRRELVGCAAGSGLELEREFLLGLGPDIAGAPEQYETWAFLFRRGGTV